MRTNRQYPKGQGTRGLRRKPSGRSSCQTWVGQDHLKNKGNGLKLFGKQIVNSVVGAISVLIQDEVWSPRSRHLPKCCLKYLNMTVVSANYQKHYSIEPREFTKCLSIQDHQDDILLPHADQYETLKWPFVNFVIYQGTCSILMAFPKN